VGAVGALVSLILAYRLFRTTRGDVGAILATASCVLVFMLFGNVSFWTRADPLLILLVTAALHAARLPASAQSFTIVTAIAGLAANLKVTGFLYVLPVAMLALYRPRPRSSAKPGAMLGVRACVCRRIALWQWRTGNVIFAGT
jgi:hypothetical protein